MTNHVPPTPQNMNVIYPESSASKHDWMVVFYRRRYIALGALCLALVVAFIMVSLRAPLYSYTTTIEVGSALPMQLEEGKKKVLLPMPMEPMLSIVAKLEKGFIPAVLQDMASKDDKFKPFGIKVVLPKDTGLILLESMTSTQAMEKSKAHAEAQSAIAQKLIEDHTRLAFPIRAELQRQLDTAKLKLDELTDANTLELRQQQLKIPLIQEKMKLERLRDPRIFGVQRQEMENQLRLATMKLEELQDSKVVGLLKKGLEAQIEKAKLTLQDLEGSARFIQSEINAVAEKKTLLDRQIKTQAAQIAETDVHRRKAAENSKGEAMAVLLMDNEIQQSRNRLVTLEERLYIDLPSQRQKLDKQLEDNRREQEIQYLRIAQLEGELVKFLVDNQREQEKQKLTINELDGKQKKMEVENVHAQNLSDPVIGEMELRSRKLAPEHAREVAAQKQLIEEIEQQQKNVRDTHIVVAPVRSLKAPTIPSLAILLLGLVVGLIMAVAAVIVTELGSTVKGRAEDERSNTARLPRELASVARLAREAGS